MMDSQTIGRFTIDSGFAFQLAFQYLRSDRFLRAIWHLMKMGWDICLQPVMLFWYCRQIHCKDFSCCQDPWNSSKLSSYIFKTICLICKDTKSHEESRYTTTKSLGSYKFCLSIGKQKENSKESLDMSNSKTRKIIGKSYSTEQMKDSNSRGWRKWTEPLLPRICLPSHSRTLISTSLALG